MKKLTFNNLIVDETKTNYNRKILKEKNALQNMESLISVSVQQYLANSNTVIRFCVERETKFKWISNENINQLEFI